MDFHIGTNRCNEMVQSAKENPCESRPAKIYLARPIQKPLREFFIQKSADILPELNCALAVFIMLYKKASHIYAETVTAHSETKAHNIFKFFKRCFRAWCVHWLLPFFCRIRFVKAIVQSRLMRKKFTAQEPSLSEIPRRQAIPSGSIQIESVQT